MIRWPSTWPINHSGGPTRLRLTRRPQGRIIRKCPSSASTPSVSWPGRWNSRRRTPGLRKSIAAEELLHAHRPAQGLPFRLHRLPHHRLPPQAVQSEDLLTGLALQHDLGLLIEQVSDTLTCRTEPAGRAGAGHRRRDRAVQRHQQDHPALAPQGPARPAVRLPRRQAAGRLPARQRRAILLRPQGPGRPRDELLAGRATPSATRSSAGPGGWRSMCHCCVHEIARRIAPADEPLAADHPAHHPQARPGTPRARRSSRTPPRNCATKSGSQILRGYRRGIGAEVAGPARLPQPLGRLPGDPRRAAGEAEPPEGQVHRRPALPPATTRPPRCEAIAGAGRTDGAAAAGRRPRAARSAAVLAGPVPHAAADAGARAGAVPEVQLPQVPVRRGPPEAGAAVRHGPRLGPARRPSAPPGDRDEERRSSAPTCGWW